MTDQLPATTGGRFVKGQSGNPAGRPPNTKNKLANLRKELEIAVLEHVGIERLKRIINKVAERAEAGDVRAAKLLLDKVVSNAGPTEENQDTGRTVVFLVENATVAALAEVARQKSNVIDAEVTDVTTVTPPNQESIVSEQ